MNRINELVNIVLSPKTKAPPEKDKGYETLVKSMYWKQVQTKRDEWERKYAILFRTVLNKQFKDLADRIDTTNYQDEDLPYKLMEQEPIEKIFIQLYQSVGVAFAREQFIKLKDNGRRYHLKKDPDQDTWREYINAWVKQRATKRIVSITNESRRQAQKIIKEILAVSIEEGFGAQESARMIKRGLEEEGIKINQWRSLMIARTEVMTASNISSLMSAKKWQEETDIPLDKFWIRTYDERTRDTHKDMEEQNPKNLEEPFIVGGFPAECPGDPDLPADEVINCRCTIAFKVREEI